jgi:hypothetical protein
MGLKVIKESTFPYERSIAQYLCSPESELSTSPLNHCAPVYEILDVPGVPNAVIFVMPLLREAFNPAFETIGEVVDFLHQMFEVSGLKCVITSSYLSSGSQIHA